MQYDLVDIFKQYFQIRLPRTKEDIEALFRLRYEVFCREFHFEKEEDCPKGRECDLFDPFSIHALLYHIPEEVIAGTIRVIQPNPQLPPLPFQNFCDPKALPTPGTQYAEVSRLTIAKTFRRRRWDGQLPSGVGEVSPEMEKFGRQFPLPALSMIFAGAALGRLQKLDLAYAMMEPRLVHAIAQYGIYFDQIGDIVFYHGDRAAYRIVPSEIWETIHPKLLPLLDYIYAILSQTYQPSNKIIENCPPRRTGRGSK